MKVNSGSLRDLICEKRYVSPQSDWNTIKRSVGFDWLSIFDQDISENLSETNSKIILKICNLLRIETKIEFDEKYSSQNATEKILEICKKFGATTYLSGPSGKKYLELSRFEKIGIEVEFSKTPDIPEQDSIIGVLNKKVKFGS